MYKKVISSVLTAAVVTCIGMAVVSGCSKEAKEEASPNAPEVYMNDPVFRKQLDAQDEKRTAILKKRSALKEKYDAEKARNPKSAALDELEKQLQECETEFLKNQRETQAIVRRRLTSKNK